jgi:hypothetical protein
MRNILYSAAGKRSAQELLERLIMSVARSTATTARISMSIFAEVFLTSEHVQFEAGRP